MWNRSITGSWQVPRATPPGECWWELSAALRRALWDLKGKALGVPVFQLLGGAYRDRIRLYADVGRGVDMANTPESWAARAREAAAEGFDAIKFDIDHAADEASHDVAARGLSLVELSRMTKPRWSCPQRSR